MGARELGPRLGEPKPHGKIAFVGTPSPDMTYLPTFLGAVNWYSFTQHIFPILQPR